MKRRIEILKNIMELEKKYALEEIDSETFEKKMQIYEKQLRMSEELTEKEFMEAVKKKEIPFSVERFMGKITIEDLLPTFNIPRTFYRHLKIRRELKVLKKNIQDLKHNIQKLKLLIAEKKVNIEAANVKLETLEFDLRLAENRYGAREKYLKRNPSKGDLLRFTLENYHKFSFGHGISNEAELKKIIAELKQELALREEYRKALAEMLATMKTSQRELTLNNNKKNTLPDFKSLLDYQEIINEIKDYLYLLGEDVKDYSKCLSLLEEEVLCIDESLELSDPADFGIETLSSANENTSLGKQQQPTEVDPLLETLSEQKELTDPIGMFLIDTTDSSLAIQEEKEEEPTEVSDRFIIPKTPEVVYQPTVNLEVIGAGMEDFSSPIEINATEGKINEATKRIIFQSFEGILEQLLEKDNGSSKALEQQPEAVKSSHHPPPAPAETTAKVRPKVKFTPLKKDLEKGKITHPERVEQREKSLEMLTEEMVIEEEKGGRRKEIQQRTHLPPPPPPEGLPAPPAAEVIKREELPAPVDISTTQKHAIPTLPPPPPPSEEQSEGAQELSEDEQVERQIDELTAELVVEEEEEEKEKEETKPDVPPPPRKTALKEQETIPDIIKPQKTSMISDKLLEAASEAWNLAGKAVFKLEESKRKFVGYIQEVVIFDKNRLGFMLVSESCASQTIIDNIFNQIKPLWITEDYLESAEKRKEYVIQEVVESLRVPRDVALHITKLQEFTNFRNVNFPTDIPLPPAETIGILPVDKIRIKQGTLVCQENALLPLKPYRTAPWDGKLIVENHSPVGKDCYHSQGQKIGKIIAIVFHPLLGKLLLINTGVPDLSLVDYLMQRLEIVEENPQEKLWLLKYLIAKQLKIPEGEALRPKTLINYSLERGFPILPHEILNSFRVFVSGGAVEKHTKKKIILKNASRIFHPGEIYPLACLRVREITGRHLGMSLGISLSDKPVLLISEKLSREIAALFTNATVEKEVMDDIAKSVMGTIGVDFKDSLCTHNVLKSLIVGKKINSLQEYGKYLTLMNVSGIDLNNIQVVEKGTIFVKTKEEITQNIFETQ